MSISLEELIVQDIWTHQRTFLPGRKPSEFQVRQNLRGSVRFDGLDPESRALLLSTLPSETSSLYVRPMDKGLSGAHVLDARYRVDGSWSKHFVMKVGRIAKLEQEARATETLVAPFIIGIENPVFRVGGEYALLVQELRGLSGDKEPTSLRLHVRNVDGSDATVGRLLNVRLRPWYVTRAPTQPVPIRRAFKWHLSKSPTNLDAALPKSWQALPEMVATATGRPSTNESALRRVLDRSISVRLGIMHGDLHAQNVLVDAASGECWPIDFGWCARGFPAVVDLAMLECSLKFLAVPMRADLRSLMGVETELASNPLNLAMVTRVPYSDEINRCLKAVLTIRQFATRVLALSIEDYLAALTAMTFSLASHQGLNRPYVLSSLYVLLDELEGQA